MGTPSGEARHGMSSDKCFFFVHVATGFLGKRLPVFLPEGFFVEAYVCVRVRKIDTPVVNSSFD